MRGDSISAVLCDKWRVWVRNPANEILDPRIVVAAVSTGRAHGIEWIAILFPGAGTDRALIARVPGARVRQAEIVTEFVSDDADVEVAVADPNSRTAHIGERAKHQKRF